jgi:hypothetical protein
MLHETNIKEDSAIRYHCCRCLSSPSLNNTNGAMMELLIDISAQHSNSQWNLLSFSRRGIEMLDQSTD